MISLLVPTRGRPENTVRLTDSVIETVAAPEEVEIVWYVDDDDDAPDPVSWPDHTVIVRGPRIVLSECWNRCAEAAKGGILWHGGDDNVFRTPGWDRLVTDAFEAVPDRLVLVYGRDGLHDQRLATHPFLHRRWVELMGRIVPPHFSSDWNDRWNHEVAAAAARLRFLPDLYIEHMHPAAGKAEWDQTHNDRLERGRRDDVDGIYRRLTPERERDVAKLRAAVR